MEDFDHFCGWCIAVGCGVISGFILCLVVIGRDCDYNYKQGQIDALTGKIRYELIIKSDSTRVWEEIKTLEKGR